jgi:hypothetical protein
MNNYGFITYKNNGYGSQDYALDSYMQDEYVEYDPDVDPVGDPVFTTQDNVWMVVDQYTVGATSTVIKNYPAFSGWTIKAFITYKNSPPPSSEPLAPVVTITGTEVIIGPDGSGISEAMDVVIVAKNGEANSYTDVVQASDYIEDIETSYNYFFTISDDLGLTIHQSGIMPLGFGDPDFYVYYDPASQEHTQYLYLLRDLGMPYIDYSGEDFVTYIPPDMPNREWWA